KHASALAIGAKAAPPHPTTSRPPSPTRGEGVQDIIYHGMLGRRWAPLIRLALRAIHLLPQGEKGSSGQRFGENSGAARGAPLSSMGRGDRGGEHDRAAVRFVGRCAGF